MITAVGLESLRELLMSRPNDFDCVTRETLESLLTLGRVELVEPRHDLEERLHYLESKTK
jgi:hypothetical protein